MIFHCPNCWSRIKKSEEVCHECKADIEPLDHRSYFEKLANAVSHSERTTRIRAAYILGELGDGRAIKPFPEVVSKPGGIKDVFFIEMVSIALGKLDGEEALPVLIRLMDTPSFLVRRADLNSLSKFKTEKAVGTIKKALEDPSLSIQELARNIRRTPEKNMT